MTLLKKFINNEPLQDFFEIIAKTLFLLYAMLGFNSVLYGHRIVSYVMWPALLLCAGVIGWRTLKFKRYYKMPGIICVILFVFSHCLSTILNLEHAIKDNIILAIYFVIYFLLFYVHPTKKDSFKTKKEFTYFSTLYITFSFLTSVISLGMFVRGYSNVAYYGDDNYEVVTGFIWGRLWGVFLDPNRGALIMLVAIGLAIYLFVNYKNIITRVLSVISIIPMFLYIVFADSRTTIVAMFFAVLSSLIVYLFLYRKNNVKKSILNLLLCIILPVISVMSPFAIRNAYTSYVQSVKQQQNAVEQSTEVLTEQATEAPTEKATEAPTEKATEAPTEKATEAPTEQQTEPQNDSKITLNELDRLYDTTEDISNRRFSIWKSGVELIAVKPVFGFTYNGFRPYAIEFMPETYIVNNDSVLFTNLHNEILNILVSQGVFGLLTIVTLIIIILRSFFKNYKNLSDRKRKNVSILVGIIIGSSAGAMFISHMFYTFSASTPMFWLCLGYMVYLLKNPEKDTKTE